MKVFCLNCGAVMIRGVDVRYYPSKLTINGDERLLFVCPRCSSRRYVSVRALEEGDA